MTLPASANATTNGGDIRKFARTSWWILASKFLLPDRTAAVVRLFSLIALPTGSGRGPLFPMQVVQP